MSLCLFWILLLIVSQTMARDCQDLLGSNSPQQGGDTSQQMNVPLPKEIVDLLPHSYEETPNCRFDLLNLSGEEGLINQLAYAGYKFCLGCDRYNDGNMCHSVQVCARDTWCINGSHADPLHGLLSFGGFNTESWHGCCNPIKSTKKCKTRDSDISIDIPGFSFKAQLTYKLQICQGPLCNVGPQLADKVRLFELAMTDPAALHIWGSWEAWSSCNCVTQQDTRRRVCTGTSCLGSDTDTRRCVDNSTCPVNGGWTNFTDWSACDVTCGGGNQSRVRFCVNPTPANGGAYCYGDQREIRHCNTQSCPDWNAWSTWSSCYENNRLCWKTRLRHCSTGNDEQCTGESGEVLPCGIDECHHEPVDGGWSPYSDWHSCSLTCGNGTQVRVRHCNNPTPSGAGKQCVGSSTETRACNTATCPYWLPWQPLSKCKLANGACLQYRLRNCSSGFPHECGGKDNEIVPCHPDACIPKWSNWSVPTSCELHAGLCFSSIVRFCSTGREADCSGRSNEVFVCPHHCCDPNYNGTGCGMPPTTSPSPSQFTTTPNFHSLNSSSQSTTMSSVLLSNGSSQSFPPPNIIPSNGSSQKTTAPSILLSNSSSQTTATSNFLSSNGSTITSHNTSNSPNATDSTIRPQDSTLSQSGVANAFNTSTTAFPGSTDTISIGTSTDSTDGHVARNATTTVTQNSTAQHSPTNTTVSPSIDTTTTQMAAISTAIPVTNKTHIYAMSTTPFYSTSLGYRFTTNKPTTSYSTYLMSSPSTMLTLPGTAVNTSSATSFTTTAVTPAPGPAIKTSSTTPSTTPTVATPGPAVKTSSTTPSTTPTVVTPGPTDNTSSTNLSHYPSKTATTTTTTITSNKSSLTSKTDKLFTSPQLTSLTSQPNSSTNTTIITKTNPTLSSTPAVYSKTAYYTTQKLLTTLASLNDSSTKTLTTALLTTNALPKTTLLTTKSTNAPAKTTPNAIISKTTSPVSIMLTTLTPNSSYVSLSMSKSTSSMLTPTSHLNATMKTISSSFMASVTMPTLETVFNTSHTSLTRTTIASNQTNLPLTTSKSSKSTFVSTTNSTTTLQAVSNANTTRTMTTFVPVLKTSKSTLTTKAAAATTVSTSISNVTGTPVASNATGTPLASNFTGTPIASNVTGTPPASNVTGTPLASNVTGTPLASSVTGTPLTSSVTGTPFASNVTGTPLVTTTKAMVTIPPKEITCAICAGPPEACELAYFEDTCQPPNHYCINHVINKASGQRLVERRCGNIHDCYHDWYLGSSDDDKCRQLSTTNILTYNFECSYCCIKDGCNVDLHPKHDTLYMNV